MFNVVKLMHKLLIENYEMDWPSSLQQCWHHIAFEKKD